MAFVRWVLVLNGDGKEKNGMWGLLKRGRFGGREVKEVWLQRMETMGGERGEDFWRTSGEAEGRSYPVGRGSMEWELRG